MPAVSRTTLVIFDWAGTTVDFGSCAPARAFQNVFAERGIAISSGVARGPMGTNKRDHLIEILSTPDVAASWKSQFGRDWQTSDVDDLYHAFIDVQLKTIADTTVLVPGLLQTVARLSERGIHVAGTTGYFRAAADAVRTRAQAAGFSVSFNVCADDVPEGRPAPWMIYRVMEHLGIYPAAHVINIGDTIADIRAGLAAGCWSVGVCDSSSETGLSLEQFNSLDEAERTKKVEASARAFRDAGCHAVVRTISDLPRLIDAIDAQADPSPTRLDAWY
jgi:phosphonoacetaldehyde hydrolase